MNLLRLVQALRYEQQKSTNTAYILNSKIYNLTAHLKFNFKIYILFQ